MVYFMYFNPFFRFYDSISHTLFLSVPHQSIFVYIWIKKKWFNYMNYMVKGKINVQLHAN